MMVQMEKNDARISLTHDLCCRSVFDFMQGFHPLILQPDHYRVAPAFGLLFGAWGAAKLWNRRC